MKYLLNRSKYIKESVTVYNSDLLDILNAKPFYPGFNLKTKLSDLINTDEFNVYLSENKLYRDSIVNIKDFETFFDQSKNLKFLFLYKDNSLTIPEYILIETDNIDMYQINIKDINDFYNLLTCKSITLFKDGKKYIYQTSSVNIYDLRNLENESSIFKSTMSRVELENIIKTYSLKFKINI